MTFLLIVLTLEYATAIEYASAEDCKQGREFVYANWPELRENKPTVTAFCVELPK